MRSAVAKPSESLLDRRRLYIDGGWVEAADRPSITVVDPASERPAAQVAAATTADLDRAVAAARRAFAAYSQTAPADRLALLETLRAVYKRRQDELAEAVSLEMGAPIDLARGAHAGAGRRHIRATVRALREFRWRQPNRNGNTLICYEPVGVCGLITPWNWPLNQIAAKLLPALAAGCTVVLKPSEAAPLSALLFADIVAEAGFPAGVFNLLNGSGATLGAALAAHPQVDMVSFTGSTRAGKAVAAAAATVKRVALELGGKSPGLIFADVPDLEKTVRRSVKACFYNTGQSCNAPTRMLVEASVYRQALAVAERTAAAVAVGDPAEPGSHLGPLANAAQYAKVQELIAAGIDQGARLLAGGPGRPADCRRGYFARPTVFADVQPEMRIAREEIFGPVLCVQPFEDEHQAVELANDTVYGLAAYVHTGDHERAARLAQRLRAGVVQINGARHSSDAPFGGFKQSGYGREFGRYGLLEFLQLKSISGLR